MAMRRILCCVLALLAVGLLATAYAEANTTLLVYMCGSGLQDAACEDIYEMGIAENGDDVNIVILAGGSEEWDFEEIPGNTRSLITIRDGDFESIEDWGWASMGSGDSLCEFLEYGLTEYPAEKTVVVLWNHGAGSEAGLCFDETTEEEDGLSLLEINDALYDLDEALGGFHIDVFGCDACMMATYEMAAMLSYYDIDYFVASEEVEPGTGWEYTTWLKALEEDPGMTGEELCRRIVDSYMETGPENPDEYMTLSAVDLSRMEELQGAIEDFASALLGELEGGNIAQVRRGRSGMYTFGSYVDGSWDMVDMGAMLDAYAKFDPENAARARKLLAEAVPVNRQTDNLDACSGLSMLIPQDTKDEFETYWDGMDLSFYMPNWIGFVKAYAGQLKDGSYSFSAATPQQVSDTSVLSGLIGALVEGFGWNEGTEEYEQVQTQASDIDFGEGDYAFVAGLSAQDMQYLDYVEGMLVMDVSDGEQTGYVDLGLMRNNLVDWQNGSVYSLFDGTWPTFGDQLVPLYDQLSNERGRRSLIPVKLNGEYTYLVVEFPAGGGEGRVIGANAGYDDSGLPIRNTTPLKPGDSIIPVYTLLTDTGMGEDMEETEFDGDEILWQPGMTVSYESMDGEEDDDGEPLVMGFCFVLNDVFGDYTMTDLIEFEA